MFKDKNESLREHYGRRSEQTLTRQLREKAKPKVEHIGEHLKRPSVKL